MLPKLIGLRTVGGRVRALTALALVALAAVFVLTSLGIGDARDGLRALGPQEGRMVVATSDMYLALSDMDAQVTSVLLTGDEAGWLCDPDEEARDCERGSRRYLYDIRREDAQKAAVEAALLAEGDEHRRLTVQSVLDGLAAYDQYVQAAMEPGRRAAHSAGVLSPEAIRQYRAATDLMTGDLLPKAYNLTLDGAADVDTAYRDEHAAVAASRYLVIGAGVALVAALAGLQVYLTRRFRRLLNPPLALALAGALALTVAGASLLATEADHMKAAKTRGFDRVLDLTQDRALAKGLDTDRGRQILDPANADRYDQMYLEKSQTIRYIKGVNSMAAYYARLARAAGKGAALRTYRQYQAQDRIVREKAGSGQAGAAVRAHLDGRWRSLPHPTFRNHDEALDSLITRREFVRVSRVADGDRALEPWSWLPAAGALAIAALIVAGVWPRLSEYR